MVFQNNVLGGASNSAGTTGYTIDQSIRFNQADNASMSRTPSSASNKKTWTFSWWWKRGALSGSTNGTNERQVIFGTSAFSILSNHNSTQIDGINVVYTGASNDVQTSEKFRDTSAWYNFQAVLDTTNDVASERFRLYKNGQRITDFASITNPAKDTEYTINNTQAHYIGLRSSGENLDGYLAEIVFIDGQALEPSSFGEYSNDGIWQPIDVSGLTFGTNGFWIDGRDSGDLGDDESGEGNDYSTTGMGAHDQVFDTPTNNFCVLNPLSIPTYGGNFNRGVAQTNLAAYNAGGAETYAIGTMAFSSGKWYWEFYTTSYPAGNGIVYGITEQDYWEANGTTSHSYIGKRAGLSERHTTSAYSYWVYNTSSISASSITPFGQGVVVGVAVDMSTNTITFTNNGSAYGSKDFDDFSYAFGSNAQFPVWRLLAATTLNVNFGQDSTFNGQVTAGGNSDANGHGNFKYSVPSGHLALCTKNLGS